MQRLWPSHPVVACQPGRKPRCAGGFGGPGPRLGCSSQGEWRRSQSPGSDREESSSKMAVLLVSRRHSGDICRARHFVASGLNPQQTFLELIDERWVSPEWRRKAQNFRYNLGGSAVRLEPEPERASRISSSQTRHPQLRNAFMVILGLEHFEQFPEIVRHHEAEQFHRPSCGEVARRCSIPLKLPRKNTQPSCGRSCRMPSTATLLAGIEKEKDTARRC